MSAHIQALGHKGEGVGVGVGVGVDVDVGVDVGVGGGVPPPSDTESIVTVHSAPELCEVTASPASSVEPRFSVIVEPGITVQVTPSADVKALNVPPDVVTIR